MAQRSSHRLLIAALVLVGIGLVGGACTAAYMAARYATGVYRTTPGPTTNRPGGSTESSTTSGTTGVAPDSGGYKSNGERIYFTGVGHAGRIEVEWQPSGTGGMMGPQGRGPAMLGCDTCHGADGRGREIGMMFSLRSADIRYSVLTAPHVDDESSATIAPWTDADISRAIREGLEPDGEQLSRLMPRWLMDDIDMSDTIDYLKELQ